MIPAIATILTAFFTQVFVGETQKPGRRACPDWINEMKEFLGETDLVTTDDLSVPWDDELEYLRRKRDGLPTPTKTIRCLQCGKEHIWRY